MNNNKQSSVEWLFEQIARRQGSILQTIQFYDDNQDLLQQAKAMHKQELGQTWDDSLDNLKARGMNEMKAYADFDDYYNETFGGKNE